MSDLLQMFLIGVASSYGPCLASCWPVALPYVTAAGVGWQSRLRSALLFLLAKLLVYVAAGLAAAALGRIFTGWLRIYSEELFMLSGIIIIILGLKAALTEKHSCSAFQKYIKPGGSLAAPALLGVFTGIMPCPTSLAVVAYIALSAESPAAGAALGFSFGVGKFFSPLLPATLLVSFFAGRLKTDRIWIRRICGLLVCLLGLRLIL